MSEPSTDLSLSMVEAAARQAARKVIQRAMQAGTSVVVWEDGRVKKIPADKLGPLLAALEKLENEAARPKYDR